MGLSPFTFSPISQEFTVDGKNSSRVFAIHNDSLTDRIAVKVSVFARKMDEEGRETLEPCPGDFLIYPSQNILAPGETRSVRVKWQGGPVSGREKAYRIIAEQLPVDLQEEQVPEEGGGIRFTFRYEGSLYVITEGGEPSLELNSIKTVMKEGSSWLELQFDNRGSRHVIMGDLNITLNSPYNNFDTIELGPDKLKGVSGENILAGNRRIFLIPEPPEVQGEDLLWDFSYKPVY